MSGKKRAVEIEPEQFQERAAAAEEQMDMADGTGAEKRLKPQFPSLSGKEMAVRA